MSINHAIAADDGRLVVTIRVSEYFDYQSLQAFREAFLERFKTNVDADYVVDLSLTEYIDSCALGMLLSLDKNVRKRCRKLQIINCSEHVRKIFSVVNFDRKLAIS